jgi:3-methyladenine DNA glycosylase AlkD
LLDEVEEWTHHSDFWMRRATLVYTLPFAKPGQDPERMLTWASGYASDPEWFIQKAIGWWLRVLGAHNPARVILFLNNNGHLLKGVAKKEALRKLAPEWQKQAGTS